MSPPPPGATRLPAPLSVRLVRAEEWSRWQATLAQHHYLGCPRPVGEALWYVATAGDRVGRLPRLGDRGAQVPAPRCLDRLGPAAAVAAAALRGQ